MAPEKVADVYERTEALIERVKELRGTLRKLQARSHRVRQSGPTPDLRDRSGDPRNDFLTLEKCVHQFCDLVELANVGRGDEILMELREGPAWLYEEAKEAGCG